MLPISEGCPEDEREGGCCTGWVSQAADSEKSLQTGCLLRSVPGTFPGGGRGEEGNRIGQRGKVSLADPTGTQDHGDLHSRVPLERADQAFIPAPLDTATVGRVWSNQPSAVEAKPAAREASPLGKGVWAAHHGVHQSYLPCRMQNSNQRKLQTARFQLSVLCTASEPSLTKHPAHLDDAAPVLTEHAG